MNPYDELPYRDRPLDWTSPERMALASLLHGGPRARLHGHRMLELGCANGANLVPLAWYGRHASFVGIDGSRRQIEQARERVATLGLPNLSYLCVDFRDADAELDGQFDFIVGHGILSWVDDRCRDALLELCARRLAPGGLLYLSYNTLPGWAVRGMVRDFLLGQTAAEPTLAARVEASRAVCARLLEGMEGESEHPYRQLMKNELQLVCDGEASYLAHEYLAPENRAYWRGDMLARLAAHGLHHVADADFDRPWNRGYDGLDGWLDREGIVGRSIADTVDLLLYRQFHAPILTTPAVKPRPLEPDELGRLHVASCLAPLSGEDGPWQFEHPSGYTVDVTDATVREGLLRLLPCWPRALRVDEAFSNVTEVLEDLPLLHRNGLVDLRLWEPAEGMMWDPELNRHEQAWGGYRTSALHRWEALEDDAPATAQG